MEVYQVGGSVRDELLHLEPKDLDWVVVGSSEEEMLSLGYRRVGLDFPVFLHPQTGDEHALARTEKKVSAGYSGFEVSTENVTLKQDAMRRDLTINSMAKSSSGELVDYFGGKKDLANKVLRHVDPVAFKEDPVRVLRIARFLARWKDFTVADETVKLCKEIVSSGEMEALTPERVSLEMIRSLGSAQPSRFFVFLHMVGALKVVFPEIFNLVGKTQGFLHHPEGDAFTHTMEVLDVATTMSNDHLFRWCALAHDFGKGETPLEELPKHIGHEHHGIDVVRKISSRLKLPSSYREHGILSAKYHHHIHKFMDLKPATIVKMFDDLSVKSNHAISEYLPMVSMADARGRSSFYRHQDYPNAAIAMTVFTELEKVKLSNLATPDEIAAMNIAKRKAVLLDEKMKVVRKIRNASNPY